MTQSAHATPSFSYDDATEEEFIAYYKYLFTQEMKAAYYADKMAAEEENKPVNENNPRETIWFERACKRRYAAMRVLEKYVRLCNQFRKQAGEELNAAYSHQTSAKKETKAPENAPVNVHKDPHEKPKTSSQEMFNKIIKRRAIYRDSAVPEGQVWLGYEKGEQPENRKPSRPANGKKIHVKSDQMVVHLLKDRKVYFCSDIAPGEIWLGMQ